MGSKGCDKKSNEEKEKVDQYIIKFEVNFSSWLFKLYIRC